MKKNVLIVKASGEKVPFSREKLINSMQKAGADEQTSDDIMKYIESELYDEISTQKIYNLAFQKLKQKSSKAAGKYKLKSALMELGPSGFAFEKFIGEIFKYKGFHIEIGQIVQGKCVTHEIDVMATKGDEKNIIECKYHNRPGIVCDVKIPLYVHSRFQDVVQETNFTKNKNQLNRVWIATNTRFSSDAIKYGLCAEMNLLGWDYPKNENLKEMIDRSGLYPITCMHNITLEEKSILMNRGIILGKDLLTNRNLLTELGMNYQRAENVLKEIETICNR